MSEIPDGWQVKKIADTVLTSSGGTPSRSNPSFFKGENLWITTSELKDCCIYDSKEKISDIAIKKSAAKVFSKGTVLMAMYGATIGKLGVLGYDSTCNQACCAFLHNDDISSNFLFYYLMSIRNYLISLGSGAGQPNISQQIIKDINILLPPLSEQKKIAEILSSVDRNIEATEKLIAKLFKLKKALMQELFTKGIGHTKFKDSPLGKIPEEWEVVRLKDVAYDKYGIVDGPFGSNLKTIHYRKKGIPIIQSGFVASNYFKVEKYLFVDESKFQEQKRSAVFAGDIVMAKIGANCGGCAILPDNHPTGILAGNSLKISINPANADRFFVLFLIHYYQRLGVISKIKTETAQPAISITNLKKMKIVAPSIIEQKQIASILSANDSKIEKAKTRLEKLKDMKKGLMQDLLTGKVRV